MALYRQSFIHSTGGTVEGVLGHGEKRSNIQLFLIVDVGCINLGQDLMLGQVKQALIGFFVRHFVLQKTRWFRTVEVGRLRLFRTIEGGRLRWFLMLPTAGLVHLYSHKSTLNSLFIFFVNWVLKNPFFLV